MSRTLRIAAIVGSPNTISKTRVLIDAVITQLQHQAASVNLAVQYIELAALGPVIGGVALPQHLPEAAQQALAQIQQADLVIAGSPVYKGSYTGWFKHLVDFIPPESLVGKPVLLVATGGSDRHALVVDQQLRPLFSFFRAQTVPSAVYGADSDFEGHAIRSDALLTRVHEAATQALHLLR